MVTSNGCHLIEEIEFIKSESAVEQLLANRGHYMNSIKGAGDRVKQALSKLRMCSDISESSKEVELGGKKED